MRRTCKFLPVDARGSYDSCFEPAYILDISLDPFGKGIALLETKDGYIITVSTNQIKLNADARDIYEQK